MVFDQPMTLLHQRDRAFADLLAAEQRRRLDAEKDVHALSSVLADLAVRLDGARLEDMRRGNPSIPGIWRPADWRKFFQAVSFLPPSWETLPMSAKKTSKIDESLVTSLQAELLKVTAERDRAQAEAKNMRAQLNDLTLQLACAIVDPVPAASATDEDKPGLSEAPEQRKPLSRPVPLSSVVPDQAALPPSDVPGGVVPSKAELLTDLREMLKTLPEACPTSWVKKLNGGKSEPRSDKDAKKAWRRKAIVIYLLGRWGINAKLEIEHLISLSEGVNSNSGSLHRALDQIIEGEILLAEQISMTGASASLKLLRLSKDGRRIYSALFNAKAVESEWERIIRLHEGETYPNHTLGILIFTMHARARGWRSEALPKVKNTNAVPDLFVTRGEESYYVEVELSNKEYNAKWRNLSDINDGKVALCAATAERRSRLAGDCKLLKLPGFATDIETLKTQCKYEDLNEETPLWIDTWEV